jgi:hypothetical protein
MFKKFAIGLATAGSVLLLSGSAQAQSCAERMVTGIGKASLTAPGARFSARTAWRRAVISRRDLGARYAVISLAKRASHSCRPSGNRTICRYSAIPCRL